MEDGRDLLLGVDGGGTRCRARLATRSGALLAEGEGGPANLRLGFLQAFAAVLDATGQCLAAAGLPRRAFTRLTACLALAGASEPLELAAAQRHPLPFAHTVIVTDAEAACRGAHGGGDGGVVIAGTGSIGWGIAGGQRYRVGGWGLPLSDEGSGAWLGRELIRLTLHAYDGRRSWTPLLAAAFGGFGRDPHALVRWADAAKPADYALLAPLLFEHARRGDPLGDELARLAAAQIAALAARLVALGVPRIALVGGVAASLEPYLAADTRRHLVLAEHDALAGALHIAAAAVAPRAAAE
ncbi:MAG: N-acetylglucosamine kinase [Alphaproteobacteria bacterium]|nr:N-acetylglucosamine kinase [Alphaproteobacteria bacterium]